MRSGGASWDQETCVAGAWGFASGSHNVLLTFLYELSGDPMLSGLFPFAYAAVFICLLLQAFRMMRLSSATSTEAPSDRTGLKTVHPELLDENGVLTNEELWAVRFSDKDGVVTSEGSP